MENQTAGATECVPSLGRGTMLSMSDTWPLPSSLNTCVHIYTHTSDWGEGAGVCILESAEIWGFTFTSKNWTLNQSGQPATAVLRDIAKRTVCLLVIFFNSRNILIVP